MAATLRLAGAAAVLLAAPAVVGCELTSVELAETADVIVAEVYLQAGQATQRALLHRTVGSDAGPRVDGAVVRITDLAGGAIVLAAAPDSVCLAPDSRPGSPGAPGDAPVGGSCYEATAPGFVRAAAAYSLEIELPDGRRMTGRTTVPGDFDVVRPAERCRLDQSSLELLWTQADGAWAYQVEALFRGLAAGLEARGVEHPPDTLRLLGVAVSASDTTLAFPAELGVFDRFDLDRDLLLALQQGLPYGARADLVIAAGDRNFVNWVRGGSFNPSGQVRIPSVTGDGTGVFAGLVVRERTLVAPGDPDAEDLPGCQ